MKYIDSINPGPFSSPAMLVDPKKYMNFPAGDCCWVGLIQGIFNIFVGGASEGKESPRYIGKL